MSVQMITTEELRRMNNCEGLILQGCGGDPLNWINGINELLTEAEILLDGTKFDEEYCYVFDNDRVTCILFPFDDRMKLDFGKLAMWRIQTHNIFGGTWLSDYVPNQLDGFINEKGAVISDDEGMSIQQ